MMISNRSEFLAKTHFALTEAGEESRDWLIEQPTEICDKGSDAALMALFTHIPNNADPDLSSQFSSL